MAKEFIVIIKTKEDQSFTIVTPNIFGNCRLGNFDFILNFALTADGLKEKGIRKCNISKWGYIEIEEETLREQKLKSASLLAQKIEEGRNGEGCFVCFL